MLANAAVRIIVTGRAAHLNIRVYVEQSGDEMMGYFKQESRALA